MNIRVSIFWNHLYILLFFFKVKLSPIKLSSQVKLNPILLINDKLYGYVEDNNYFIASYDTKNKVNDNSYNYMFSYEDIILTINDKKIDIMNTDLKSTLIMRITTYYDYTIEKERDSLNIKVRDNILYFNVKNEDEKYTSYKYDIKNKKILT